MARQREPGWYSDPGAPGQWRWWDGQAWTEHAVAYPAGKRRPGWRKRGRGDPGLRLRWAGAPAGAAGSPPVLGLA
ncbi:MAG: DUF2510 domain-containing protein, partial [Acidimicrobiales bacterium]